VARSNQAARQRNARGRLNRREKGQPRLERDHRIARVDASDLVIPDGSCLRNPRRPKAKFNTREKAAAALRQAQQQRARLGSGHVERRFYLCEESEGGCGAYHLTSRESYEPAWKRGQS
jgi:hypothetical protein